MNFLKEGLSMDETRVSTLVFALIVGFIFSLYQAYTAGDISSNLCDLIKTLILVVGGVNGLSSVASILSTDKTITTKDK